MGKKAPFSKVATLEPGGVFKEYDLHIVESLEIPLFQMDAISVNYWLTNQSCETIKGMIPTQNLISDCVWISSLYGGEK